MISKCTEADAQSILDFIGNDYCRCLYLYMDMVKYGFSTPFVSLWRENDENGAMTSIYLKYHTGMHVYAPHGYANTDEAAAFVCSEHPAMLCGVPDALAPLGKRMAGDGYEFLGGMVCKYRSPPSALDRIDVRVADGEADFVRIGEMLYADDEYGAAYKPGELARQLSERQHDGQGRSYVVERDGRIVSHVCTAAECERFSILSGGITDPSCRNGGLCSRLLFTVAEELKAAGRETYSLYYNPAAAAMHRKAGFVDCCEWGRLFRKMH